MRPLALLLLALALLAGLGLFFLFGGPEEGSGAAPLTLGLGERVAEGPASAPAGLEVPVAEPSKQLAETRAALPEEGPLTARAVDGPGGIDVLVVDGTGGPLLGTAGSLRLEEQAWARLFLGRGEPPLARDPIGSSGEVLLPMARRRASQRKGWVTAMEPPGEGTFVALAFGDFVVVSEAIEPGATEVTLVADVRDFDSMYASVEGSLGSFAEASRLVRIVPRARGGRARSRPFLPVEGEGGRFIAKRLPPGELTVMVRAEAAALVPALHAAKSAKGLTALSMGARVPSAEQWDLRLGVLRQLQLPVGDFPLTLAPGENRNLGALETTRSAAVVLELMDGEGLPVDSTSVDVMVLGAPDEPAPSLITWTFESSACLYPLRPDLTELMVVQGDLGALYEVLPQELRADAPLAKTQVRLRPLSVVVLPGEDGELASSHPPRLLTSKGRLVRIDPRWVGSRYGGHEIRGRTMAVPAGAYRIEQGGIFTAISVGPSQLIDASSGSPLPAVDLASEEDEAAR